MKTQAIRIPRPKSEVARMMATTSFMYGGSLEKKLAREVSLDQSASHVSQLTQAVKMGDLEQLQKLLLDGLDPNEADWNNNGRHPIMEAVARQNCAMVKALVEAGCDVNVQNLKGENSLHVAVESDRFNLEIFRLLLEAGCDSNVQEKLAGYTPLHILARHASFGKEDKNDVIEALTMLVGKCDVNKKSTRRSTPLHRAAKIGESQSEPIEILLEAGADLNAQNDCGETPLLEAIDNKLVNVAEMLINRGTDLDLGNRFHQAAIHYAASKNLARVTSLLVDHGCDLNSTDLNGDTALHIAASKGHSEILKILCANKATDYQLKNYKGQTPLHIANESGFGKVAEILIEAERKSHLQSNGLQENGANGIVRRTHSSNSESECFSAKRRGWLSTSDSQQN